MVPVRWNNTTYKLNDSINLYMVLSRFFKWREFVAIYVKEIDENFVKMG